MTRLGWALPAVLLLVPAVAAADPPRAGQCFGGPVTTVASGERHPSHPVVIGDALYWVAGGEVRRMALATKVKSTLGDAGGLDVKVFDPKLAVAATNVNNLEAIDLPGGKSRVLVEGQTTMEEPILFSSLALDDRYLYFGRGQNMPPFTRSPRIGFHRVRRGGGAGPEFLAAEPDGQTEFTVADGFVYWQSHHRLEGSEKRVTELVRRRLQKDAALQVIVPLRMGSRGPLVVQGGRVTYIDGDEIRSVPVDGSAPPITQATIAQTGLVDLAAEGDCVYWLNRNGALQRAQGSRGAVERIATLSPNELSEREGAQLLATDGAHLYVTDPKSGNILALGRSTAVAGAAPRTVRAERARTQRPAATWTDRLLVGSGWGCARRGSRAARQMQCWQAAGGTGPIHARPVPWLTGDHYAATADRLCALTQNGTRCWTPAQLFGAAPAGVSFAPTSLGTVWDAELAAGAGFSCTEKDNVWTCEGDDTFGQLGRGLPGDTHNRLFGGTIALGAAHGCVSGTSVLCWGRNDTGQLGLATSEVCHAGGRDVACSHGASAPSFSLPRAPAVYAADTFTCAQRRDIHCWGASRDGLFGTAASCPPALPRAFPTQSGPVAAANATCSSTPAELPAFPPGGLPVYSFSVGPRGACGVVGRNVKCAGAIPTPPALATAETGGGVSRALAVSPGDDPSACAVTRGGASCWGAGYSPAGTPERPVDIVFADLGADGPAVDGAPAPGGTWPTGCAIGDGCPPQAAPPRCPADVVGRAARWPVAQPAGGDAVIRGPLLVQATEGEALSEQRCAPAEPLPIVLGNDKSPLLVEGLACRGDESRRCCAAPAFGQEVVARGRLVASGSRWILRNPQLCTP